MVDPVSLIIFSILGLASVGTAAVFYIAFLTIRHIRDYIKTITQGKLKNEMAFIFKQKLESGKYRVATGFLDDKENMRIWDADALDQRLNDLPENEAIKIN